MRSALFLAVLLASSAAMASPLDLRVVRIRGGGGDRTDPRALGRGLRAADCADPAATTLTFRLDKPIGEGLDLWVSSGDDCAAPESRVGPSPVCFAVGRLVPKQAGLTFDVSLAELARGDVNGCASAEPGGTSLFLHGIDSGVETTTGELGELPSGSVEIHVDPIVPGAAHVISANTVGTTRASIVWEAPAGAGDTELLYRVVATPAGSGCGAPQERTWILDTVSATKIDVDPFDEIVGLAYGEGMLVGVITLDEAGNPGAVSNTVCVSLTPIAGFCGLEEAASGACPEGCSASPGRAHGGGLARLLPLALVLALGRRRRIALALVLAPVLLGSVARADERVTLTVSAGAYEPDLHAATYSSLFKGDHGPYLGAELHVALVRVPHVGPLGVGVAFGWTAYSGEACSVTEAGVPDCRTRSSETTSLRLLPLAPMLSLRIDILARELGVPLVFTPKLGFDAIFYRARTGRQLDTSGVSYGARLALEAALELDAFDSDAARALRRDFGITHAFVFGQLLSSGARSKVPVGDSLAWTAGLGVVF